MQTQTLSIRYTLPLWAGGLRTPLRHNTETQQGSCSSKGPRGCLWDRTEAHLVPRAGHTVGGGSCTCHCCSMPHHRHRTSHPAGTRWLGSRVRHLYSIQGGHRILLLPCRWSQPPSAVTGEERSISTQKQQMGSAQMDATFWHSMGHKASIMSPLGL